MASLALLTFASCSKDDGNEPEKPKEPVDAVFSIQLSDLATKAIGGVDDGINEGTINEKYIKTLNTYVFKQGTSSETSTIVAYKRSEAKGADGENGIRQVEDIIVKVVPNSDYTTSADQFIMVMVANIDDKSFNTLEDLEKATLKDDITLFNGEKFVSLPMVSETIKFGNLYPSKKAEDGTWTPVKNWVRSDGTVYKTEVEGPDEIKLIKLKRLVARVQIDKIIINMSDRYPGASFRLLNMSLANVRAETTMQVGQGAYLKGYQSPNFDEVTGKGIIIPDNGSNVKACFTKEFTDPTYYSKKELFDEENTALEGKTFSRYVFTNIKSGDTGYDTGILLSGYFKASNKVENEGELRHFWISLNKGGEVKVLPNTIYRLLVTINGEGSKNEDNPELTAGVTADITVADWVVKDQIEDDNN